MLKILILLNIALAMVNLFILSGRKPENSSRSNDREIETTGIDSQTPAMSIGGHPANSGIVSQLGGGSRDPAAEKLPPVVTAEGESWYLPEFRLQVALQNSIRSKHPPLLEEQIVADLGLDAEQSASMNEALGEAAAALIDHERSRREFLTDDEGKRYVGVPEFRNEAKQIFADLEEALANTSDRDSAAIMMIGVKNSVYFRKRGEGAKLKIGVGHDGKPAIEDWRGDWVHRLGGVGPSSFEGSCDHLLDFEELGWLERFSK